MRLNLQEQANDAFSPAAWQEIFETLTQISGNLLDAVQYMKMQDAGLSTAVRNLDRSLLLKNRLLAEEGHPQSLQQEYEILQAHIAGLSEQRYKGQSLFGETGGSVIRVYSFEDGKWITLVIDQPDLNAEILHFLRGGQIIEGSGEYTVSGEDILEAQQLLLNYRLTNGSQTQRIEQSLQRIRITLSQLTQLVPHRRRRDRSECCSNGSAWSGSWRYCRRFGAQ